MTDDSAKWHIAQYNVARLRYPTDDPRTADFMNALDAINDLGDRSPGFAWRFHDDSGNSTALRVRDDPMMIVNLTVWETIDQLFQFAYHSEHVEYFRRRREWFEAMDTPYLVLWWVTAGHRPSIAESDERLDHLIAHGPTPHAFTFKQRFGPPVH
jgi:hypothetical protein